MEETIPTPLLAMSTLSRKSIPKASLTLESHTAPLVVPSLDDLGSAGEAKEPILAANGSWKNLMNFTQLLGQLAGNFGPLKAVMDEVRNFIEIHESTMTANNQYQNMRWQLERIFEDLRRHFSGEEPPAMTTSMQNLCSAIQGELGIASRAQATSQISRFLDAKRRQDKIMECYRRIHVHLERFRLNASINVWKAAERRVAITISIQEAINNQALEALLNKLAFSTPAYYNSAEAAMLNRRSCTPGTRTEVLHILDDWVKSNTGNKLFWLNGMAGTGKTTIANTLCGTLDQSHTLAASFFCSHQLPECRNVKFIIPTLARQLARFSTPFSIFLAKAFEMDPEVHTRALRTQFEQMILGPLCEVAQAIPETVVVVIDALDECEDKNGVGRLLELIIEHSPKLPVKFFVSSRPEPQIRKTIAIIDSKMILHELEHQAVQEDIKTYFEAELERAMPSDSEIASLTERAGVLFIYAATVVRYVGAKDFSLNPRKRLAAVLDTSFGASNRTRDMDVLYEMILVSALDDPELEVWDRELIKLVLDSVVCAQEPLTTFDISKLLELDSVERVHEAIRPLWSVLHVSSDDVVTTLHASFSDYMLDISRSKVYGCHASLHHSLLALRCFDRIKNNPRRFNICQLESSFVADETVPHLETRVAKAIPSDLWYACRYWVTHLVLAEISPKQVQAFHLFMSESILLWMEVMNLKNQIGLGASLMERANKWCTDNHNNCPSSTKEIARDAWRFVLTFAGNPASASTPHIYVSMLASWPQQSPLGSCYIPRTKGLVKVKGTHMARRQPLLLSVFTMDLGITCVAFSADSVYIVSGAWDNSLRIWDARTGYSIGKPFRGHANWINSVAFSPGDTCIASGSSDTTVRLWDVRTGNMISSPLRGHTDSVRSVVFSPNGRRIVSGSADATLRVWDVNSKRLVGGPLTGHTGSINAVTFSPDGRRMASASDDKTIIIWDAETGQMVGSPLKGHSRQVLSVVFSPDSTYLVSGSGDTTLRLWNSRAGQEIGDPLKGHTAPVNSVTFSADGALVLSGSDDKTIRLWSSHGGQAIGSPLKCHSHRIYSALFSSDGARIMTASADKTVRIWDGQTKLPPTNSFDGHGDWVKTVVFSPDGTRIASSSKDKSIMIWDAITGSIVGSPLRGHSGSVNSVAFFPNEARIVSGSEDETIRVWDVLTEQMIGHPFEGHYASVNSVSVSPDGTRIVSGSDDRIIRIWDVQTEQLVSSPITGHADSITSVAFSPDGLLVASGSRDKSVRLWVAQNGQATGTPLTGHSALVNSVIFSPDSAYILSGSSDRTVRMWDTHTEQLVFQPRESLKYPITSVAFFPNGTRFVSGSTDGTIYIWDTKTDRPSGDLLRGHTGSVNSVMVSPDGAKIVSGSADTALRLWDIPKCQSLTPSDKGDASVVVSSSLSWQSTTTPAIPYNPIHLSSEGHQTASWALDDDQWVRDRQSHLLIWIPHDLRDTLVRPHNKLVISTEGSTELDFSGAKIGDSWTDCYSPS
ncbi:Lissencephaly-1 homolog [Rhizoctonia solani]|uniref:Lissencephaly-1 homolog n=1 Tax=Rhizoctonia solani TaxID=456999 RepID=A0A0K6FVC0_9AGAM|nr:Lissencephaly-1 homolog [Rhizoctonia solani]